MANLSIEDAKIPKVEKKTDIIKIENKGEENYILGLKVEGRKIIILLDASASMTNEKLIDIIKINHAINFMNSEIVSKAG